MWDSVFEAVATSGVFAVLFVSLLIYLLQDSRKREAKYQSIIDALTERLETVEDIREKIEKLVEKPTRKAKKQPPVSAGKLTIEEKAL